ncbi:uncharacterized protein [Solanum lycopersicum]|uniref:uncharacterized protein n=1 Tax=Solanum lycopersicum TaxID=4081 RepID=UPI000532D238
MSSPWPFVARGIDAIGSIDPAASNGHRFTLVAIDYFTKWVEVASYKLITKNMVADFVRNNLICRFGVPESISTDNGENLNSHFMREILYGIEAVIPAEVEIPCLRIIQEAELSNTEWVSKRIDQLTLIDEKRMVAVCHDEYKENFTPNWQGPYMVRKVLSRGALVLSDMDGTVWPKPIISDAVKRYYV